MLKKTITFEDLDGNSVTEDFYFHMFQAELIALEASGEGNSYQAMMEKIIKANNGKIIMEEFKKLILLAYGQRGEDNKRFIKSPELSEAFSQTEAYSVLFMELCLDDGAAAEFANALVPQKLSESVAKMAAKNAETGAVAELPPVDDTPAWIRENRDPNTSEMRSMTREQMQEAMAKRLSSSS